MVQLTQFAPANKPVSQTQTLPAPVGGLNARDSLAQMKPDQAVQMMNWFPLQYGVRVRKGSFVWATGITGEVETLITHAGLDGTEKLFAAAGGNIYDVTGGGVVGAPVLTGMLNSRWQWVNMTNEFGSFTIICNGADVPKAYNGTAWVDLAITANVTEYPDFDAKTFINVTISHRRLWFAQKNTGDSWYLPTDAIQGEASRFGVGEVFPRGGFLQAIGTWATESGGGMKENTVFVSSEGDIAIFAGYDPEALDTFNLAGVYRLGATFTRRCLQKFGSDLLVLCEDGVFPLSNVLSQSKVLMAGRLSDIIQLRLSEDVTLYAKEFGWEMLVVNRHQMLYLNVPLANAKNGQYVMNQVTEAWCQFEGYDALCWGMLEDEPFFGTPSGKVVRAWYGDTDLQDDTEAGQSIPALCQQAFSYFGGQAFQKRWTMMRPVFNADQYPSLRSILSTDFNLGVAYQGAPPTTIAAVAAKWDVAYWDDGLWGGGLKPFSYWFSVNQIGYCAAPFIQTQSVSETYWITTDFVFEAGGML